MDKNILIIEDDFIIQMYLEDIISEMNCTVVGTLDSSNAIEDVLKSQKVDLVLMDFGIRGKRDGVETAKFINQNYPTPIVFITGNSDKTTTKRIEEVNPLLIVFKPIDEVQLKFQLTAILKNLN